MSTPTNAVELAVQQTVFDLDSRSEVTLVKSGTFNKVADMQEFVSRLGNDAALILQVVNDGLEEYTRRQMKSDNSIPWQIEDEEGTRTEFTGTILTADKGKQFAATVLNLAKMMFGYPADKLPKGASKEEQAAWRNAKATAKQAAQDFVLANPAAVEALKK